MAVSIYDLYPSLLDACGRGDVLTAKYLLNEGLDVNYIDHEGDFPLLVASTFGRVAVVDSPLDQGANINLVNSRGESALYVAIKSGRTEVASLLKERGATLNDVPVKTGSDETTGQTYTPSLYQEQPQNQEVLTLSTASRQLIPIADEWENIGLLLNVPDDTLMKIKRYYSSVKMRIHEVLRIWMKQEQPQNVSWKKLAEAVEPIDPYVAHKILKPKKN